MEDFDERVIFKQVLKTVRKQAMHFQEGKALEVEREYAPKF